MYCHGIRLEIFKRALLAQKLWPILAGRTISKTDTPSLASQKAVMKDELQLLVPFGNTGSGVDVENARMFRFEFPIRYVLPETPRPNIRGFTSQSRGRVKVNFNGPKDIGFSTVLDSSWIIKRDQSADAGGIDAGIKIHKQASQLIISFYLLSQQFTDPGSSLDNCISIRMGQVNCFLRRLNDMCDKVTKRNYQALGKTRNKGVRVSENGWKTMNVREDEV